MDWGDRSATKQIYRVVKTYRPIFATLLPSAFGRFARRREGKSLHDDRGELAGGLSSPLFLDDPPRVNRGRKSQRCQSY